MNRKDFITPQGFCVNKEKFIQKYGAFNAFQTANGQTAADISGDLGNLKSLRNIVYHFYENEKDEMMSCFATNEIKKKFEINRFTLNRSMHI